VKKQKQLNEENINFHPYFCRADTTYHVAFVDIEKTETTESADFGQNCINYSRTGTSIAFVGYQQRKIYTRQQSIQQPKRLLRFLSRR